MYIRYRSGSVFDLCYLNTRTKTVEKLVLESLFTDDCAFMAHKEDHLQMIADRFAEATRLFGLTISLGKRRSYSQVALSTTQPRPNITIEGSQLKCVKNKYLDSTISADGPLDREVCLEA